MRASLLLPPRGVLVFSGELPTTYHLLPTTYYLPPTTYYLRYITYYSRTYFFFSQVQKVAGHQRRTVSKVQALFRGRSLRRSPPARRAPLSK